VYLNSQLSNSVYTFATQEFTTVFMGMFYTTAEEQNEIKVNYGYSIDSIIDFM